MSFARIRTINDARAWLDEQPKVSREQGHMLVIMFGDALLPALARVRLVGPSGV